MSGGLQEKHVLTSSNLLLVQSDFPNADLQKVFANKIKLVQACIDARGYHFQHLLLSAQLLSERTVFLLTFRRRI
jgi:hypothetical protein